MKLKVKIVLAISATLLIFLIPISFFIYRHQNNLIKEKAKIEAETLFRMLYVTRQWIAENRNLIKPVPAVATKELSRYIKDYDNIYFHITSDILINPANAPNEFEKRALEYFKIGGKEYIDIFKNSNNEKIYRYMRPLYINKSCLKCHQYQGYKIGDLRGGIAIYIPLKEISKILKNNNTLFLFYGLFLYILLLIILTILIDKLILKRVFKIKKAAEAVANGSFNSTIEINSKDEIGSLAKSFNTMKEKIKLNDQYLEDKIKEVTQKYNDTLEKLKTSNNYKTALLDSIGHEIRTPLTKVVSYSEILKDASNINEEFLHKTIDIIYRNVCILNEVFTQIQTLERIKDSRFLENKEIIKIGELSRGIVNKYNNNIQNKNINIIINVDNSLTFTANKFGIKLILENLIQNAIKYVDTKGFVEITINNIDSCLEIKIKNSGCKLKHNEIPKIFDRFYRGKNIEGNYSGAGLGLTIVKSIVKGMGGKIECNLYEMDIIEFTVTLFAN